MKSGNADHEAWTLAGLGKRERSRRLAPTQMKSLISDDSVHCNVNHEAWDIPA